MDVFGGTSGYSYDEWKGTFYPPDLKKDGMLTFYASKLPAVEINNTFYRMPKTAVVEKWRGQTPPGFQFVLKATRRITHLSRLQNVAEPLEYLFRVADVLDDKLGAVLFQLPPNLKKDLALLESFFELLPRGRRIALEVRNSTWFSDDTYELLERSDVALVGGDVDDAGKSPPLVATAPFGYLRLRRSDYTEAELQAWRARILEQPWDAVFAFFKHEQRGPEFARWLVEHA